MSPNHLILSTVLPQSWTILAVVQILYFISQELVDSFALARVSIFGSALRINLTLLYVLLSCWHRHQQVEENANNITSWLLFFKT